MAHLAWAVEYNNCISAVEFDPPTHTHNECPEYDIKQSDEEAPVMLELWSTPSLLLLPGPLWPRVVAPDWVLSMGQAELTFKLNANK